MKITERDPFGNAVQIGNYDGENPLLSIVKTGIARLKQMPATPTPGPHCDSWYGGPPCPCQGTTCPLADNVPGIVDSLVVVSEDGLQTASDTLRGIANSENPLPITKEIAEWAYPALLQLLGFAKTCMKQIEVWSKDSKQPFRVGGLQYGWFTSEESVTDKVYALEEMLEEMTIEEIAKIISLSKTGIGTISKRRHGKLRDHLLKFAVTIQQSKPKFGPLKNLETDEEIPDGIPSATLLSKSTDETESEETK